MSSQEENIQLKQNENNEEQQQEKMSSEEIHEEDNQNEKMSSEELNEMKDENEIKELNSMSPDELENQKDEMIKIQQTDKSSNSPTMKNEKSDSKEFKDGNDSPNCEDLNDLNDLKELKESKESNENNDKLNESNDSKEIKETKEMKDNKNIEESKDKIEIKEPNQHHLINEEDQQKINLFKNYRNYQVFQQACFIGFLNRYHTIIIQKPIKRCVVTYQIINIKSIVIDGQEIEIDRLVEQRCNERKQFDVNTGISQKTAKQRYAKNKIIEMHHLLMDILIEKHHFLFNTIQSTGKNKTMIDEVVQEVFHEKKFLLDKTMIEERGKKINEYICSLLQTKYEIEIQVNDVKLQKILDGNE